MKFIYKKRSQLSNWKIKKYHQKGGGIYYTLWFKSIFGFWRPITHLDSWGDDKEVTEFNTKDVAKERLLSEIKFNITLYGETVVEVEEIKF